MLSNSAVYALLDIRDNIMLAQQFTAGMTAETFAASRLHFYATTRALEIVSEASKRLPDTLREKHPAMPWRAMRDAGNFYRHSYDNVAENFVWETAHGLDALLAMAIAELAIMKPAT